MFESTAEEDLIREFVRQVARKYGRDYWLARAREGQFTHELWQELAAGGYRPSSPTSRALTWGTVRPAGDSRRRAVRRLRGPVALGGAHHPTVARLAPPPRWRPASRPPEWPRAGNQRPVIEPGHVVDNLQ